MKRVGFLMLLLLPGVLAAQPYVQMPGYCYPPSPPLVDEGSLATLQLTRGQEYTRYFNEAQKYMLCLDETKKMFMEEVQTYLEQYSETIQ